MQSADQYLDDLKRLCDFAYEQGFHEMGHDPVKAAADEIERLRDQLAQCELSLATYDAGRTSEYWLKYDSPDDVCTCKPLAQQTHARFGTVRVTVDAACPLHGDVGGDRG